MKIQIEAVEFSAAAPTTLGDSGHRLGTNVFQTRTKFDEFWAQTDFYYSSLTFKSALLKIARSRLPERQIRRGLKHSGCRDIPFNE